MHREIGSGKISNIIKDEAVVRQLIHIYH
jgi:hypothetical protein